MCTTGAIRRGDMTFVLKNFDYPATPTGWAMMRAMGEGHDHFALVDHAQQGVNSGMNAAGLALVISSSDAPAPAARTEELRTVLNAEVLQRCSDVRTAVGRMAEYARSHPKMRGGNVILADASRLAVVEYFGGEARSREVETGWVCRANHSCLGLLENCYQDSDARYRQMEEFLEELDAGLATLDRAEIVDRCKTLLRTAPILNTLTLSSMVFDVRQRAVYHRVGSEPWSVHRF